VRKKIKEKNQSLIILLYILSAFIGGIILFIWLYCEMGGLWAVWILGMVYVALVSMPFVDWVSREKLLGI